MCARWRRLDRARWAANEWGVRMARATNLICILVIAGTAVGVRAVHESQNEERRRLREGVIRDEARLRAREARERGREGTTRGI